MRKCLKTESGSQESRQTIAWVPLQHHSKYGNTYPPNNNISLSEFDSALF